VKVGHGWLSLIMVAAMITLMRHHLRQHWQDTVAATVLRSEFTRALQLLVLCGLCRTHAMISSPNCCTTARRCCCQSCCWSTSLRRYK
jgi:hypothetical protein